MCKGLREEEKSYINLNYSIRQETIHNRLVNVIYDISYLDNHYKKWNSTLSIRCCDEIIDIEYTNLINTHYSKQTLNYVV